MLSSPGCGLSGSRTVRVLDRSPYVLDRCGTGTHHSPFSRPKSGRRLAGRVSISPSGLLQGGHSTHLGPVWDSTLKADHIAWGDIIPPYDYTNADGTFHFAGLNWSDAGQAIYTNGCLLPGEAPHTPAIHVEKTASVDTLPAGGGQVTYSYAVTNAGDVPLSNVTVSDNKCSPVTPVSGDTDDDGLLDLGETWMFTCTATLTATTTNTATATGHFGDTTVSDTDDATVTVTPSNPAIHVVKGASVATLPAGGGSVTYTYTVTNTGNIALSSVTVADDKCAPVGFVSGDTGDDHVLGLTETWIFTCTATLTQTTTNTATATGHDGETVVTDTDQATVTVLPNEPGHNPAINVDKTASVATLPVAGGSVTYTYTVTNTGDVALTLVTVADDKCAPVTFTGGDTGADNVLGLTETWTFTCTATLTDTTTNTATATGHDGDTAVTDTDHATVTVAQPGGGVLGETNVPTAPRTDTIATGTTTSDPSGSLPILLIVLGVIGLGALMLTPARSRR